MNLRRLLPSGEIPKEILRDLSSVFEGERLFKEQNYAQAVIKYKQAIKHFPVGSGGRFMIYNKLGITYEKQGQSDRAIAIYERGAKEGTTTPFTYQRLAILYLSYSNHKKAAGYCNKGLKCLKDAKTNFFQEMYFQIILRKLRYKARYLDRDIGRD